MSKTAMLKAHLQTGASISSKEIVSKFKIANPGAAIRRLREQGICVYSNNKTDKSVSYRIGQPTKLMVALALASGYKF